LKINASNPNQQIFTDVKVYDSLKYVMKESAKKTISFTTGSASSTFLVTLQKFLSTFSFYNLPNNEILLNNQHYIMKTAKYLPCPRQENCYASSLFALGNLLHAVAGLPIDDSLFNQNQISFVRKQLHNQLADPTKMLTSEFMYGFFHYYPFNIT
jgi:hypothetical protein